MAKTTAANSRSSNSRSDHNKMIAAIKAVNDSQWGSLRAVGDLDVQSIGFRRGSSAISLSSEHELRRIKKMLDNFPSFYLRVVGQARAVGDPDANKRLAESRAQSVGDFLVKEGVSAERMRTGRPLRRQPPAQPSR